MLNDLAEEIVLINANNGWDVTSPDAWPDIEVDGEHAAKVKARRLAGIIALIHSEASEALEALRVLDKGGFAEELADVIIRTLDLAGGMGIDIDQAVQEKLEKNKGRGFRHGGKVI